MEVLEIVVRDIATGQEQTRLTLDRAWIVGQAGTDRLEAFGSIAFRPVVDELPDPVRPPEPGDPILRPLRGRQGQRALAERPDRRRVSLRFRVLGSGSTGNATLVEGEGVRILIDAGLGPARAGGAPAVGRRRPGRVRRRDLPLARAPGPREGRRLVLAQVGRAHLRQPRDVRRDGPGRRDDRGLRRARAGRSRARSARSPCAACPCRTTRRARTRSWWRTAARRWATRPTSATSPTALRRRVPRLRRGARRVEPRSRTCCARGAYPWSLKERILGPRGHLSNRTSRATWRTASGDVCRTLVLAHLSQTNNHPELAEGCADSALRRRGRTEVKIRITDADGTDWIDVRRRRTTRRRKSSAVCGLLEPTGRAAS